MPPKAAAICRRIPWFPLLSAAFFACAPIEGDSSPEAAWSEVGAYGVGSTAFDLDVSGRETVIPARLWYPSTVSGEVALADLVVDANESATLAGLIAAAPAGCPSLSAGVVVEGEAAGGRDFPLVAFSHCHTCLGISGAAIAAELARHGFVVVAPDHEGNTLFDELAGDGGDIDEAMLAQRAADVSAAIDWVLGGDSLPVGLGVDAAKIGVAGHSFGAVTAGRVLANDSRVTAAMMMGAPFDNPLLVGADATTIDRPVLLVELEEDHSVGALGNSLIEANYAELAGPAWLASMADAGHWSVSDLCGVIEDFMPGCGQDERQADGTAFSYLPADDGRAAAASLAAAFFSATLRSDASAEAWLAEPQTAAVVTVQAR